MSYHRIYLKKTIFNQWRALKSLGIQINAGLSHSLVRINLKAKNSTKNGLFSQMIPGFLTLADHAFFYLVNILSKKKK